MVEVLKTGLFDTIQDLGRFGHQEFGVPVSGVMDAYSATLANSILANDTQCAVIESTVSGPQLKFCVDTRICISGANMNATLNTNAIKPNMSIDVKAGDVLSFGQLVYGCRTYIAVLGGFLTKPIMGSRSMYDGVTSNFRLHKGDWLPISDVLGYRSVEERSNAKSLSSVKINTNHFQTYDIEVFKGPEFVQLDAEQQRFLFDSEFTISKESNRMAYQCNERLDNSLNSIITSLVLPGTVQLTPSGELIILMRDCQITGGYPRVLQLSENSVNMMSQKFLGQKLKFKFSSW